MNCHRAGDLLSPYVEGELTPPRAAALEAHLAGCDRCRAELASLRRAVGALRAPRPLVQPVGLLAEFKSRLETAPRRPAPFFRPPALWLAPAGALAAALLVGVVIYRAQMPAARSGSQRATASHAPGTQLAYAPPASSTRDLIRRESASKPREQKSDQPVASPSATDWARENVDRLSRPADARSAPAAASPYALSGRLSTPERPVGTNQASSPRRVDDLQEGAGSVAAGRAAHLRGLAGRTGGASSASGDLLALRDRAASSSPTGTSLPPAPPFAARRDEEARARAGRSKPPLLLPPGVQAPNAAPERRRIAKARPSPVAPGLPAGIAGGSAAPGAPPPATPQAFGGRDNEVPASGRAWVAVRFVTPPQPPAAGGQAASDTGQTLRAAAAPPPSSEADTSAARRSAKTARPRLALAGVSPALVALMRRPVRVSAADVPLAELLRQIGASAGAPLTLDPKVPDTMRCHAQMPDVPLYEALQKVAEATGLVIAPQGAGVILRLRGGEAVNAHSPYWTQDWGTGPENLFGTRGVQGERQ